MTLNFLLPVTYIVYINFCIKFYQVFFFFCSAKKIKLLENVLNYKMSTSIYDNLFFFSFFELKVIRLWNYDPYNLINTVSTIKATSTFFLYPIMMKRFH